MTDSSTSAAGPPKVSVGLPVYNGARYVDEAIDAILRQSFTDLELIISDNGSTDDTESICRRRAALDARVRYFRQPSNLGVWKNFEFVLMAATADAFMWCACDDPLTVDNAIADLYAGLESGLDYCVPAVDAVIDYGDGEPKFLTEITSALRGATTPLERCRVAMALGNMQFYSLFKRDRLLEFYDYIRSSSDLVSFNESVFVYAISAHLNGGYSPTAKKLYRKTRENVSSSQAPTKLARDWIKFTARAVRFFALDSGLDVRHRVELIAKLGAMNARQELLFLGAIAKRAILGRRPL